MSHLQEWFERIAGVTQEEQARRAFAHALFSKPPFDPSAFQKPACWRRKRMAGQIARMR